MPTINFIQRDGIALAIEAAIGKSIKDTAMTNDVDGIVAECGGNAMCATCHVYVDETDLNRLPEMQANEDELLESTESPREANSRLSCQLPVTEELEGLTVRIPETQYS